jgi:hypothetical protein
MLSFRQFRESAEKDDKKATEVVRKGMDLGDDFWDDFLSLCGNAEGMADLLGAPREKVTALGGRVRGIMSEIKEKDSASSKRDKMIKTGDKT